MLDLADTIKSLSGDPTAFALADDRDDASSMTNPVLIESLDAEPVPVSTTGAVGSGAFEGAVFGAETVERELATGVNRRAVVEAAARVDVDVADRTVAGMACEGISDFDNRVEVALVLMELEGCTEAMGVSVLESAAPSAPVRNAMAFFKSSETIGWDCQSIVADDAVDPCKADVAWEIDVDAIGADTAAVADKIGAFKFAFVASAVEAAVVLCTAAVVGAVDVPVVADIEVADVGVGLMAGAVVNVEPGAVAGALYDDDPVTGIVVGNVGFERFDSSDDFAEAADDDDVGSRAPSKERVDEVPIAANPVDLVPNEGAD